jgi:hypothetical protein
MAIIIPANLSYSTVGATFFVAVSVAASTSITQDMNFRGIYIPATCTIGIWGIDDITASFTNPVIGQILWVAGRAMTLTGSVASGCLGIR